MPPSRCTLATTFALVFGAAGLVSSCHWRWHEDDEAEAWNRCSVNSDCTLAASSCCGPCDKPSLADVDAVNRDFISEHFQDVCPEPVPCPKCATFANPDLGATCSLYRCEAVDVRELALSQCEKDADCKLRVTGCCECGGSTAPWDLIAINVAGEPDYAKLTCDPEQACPECAPIYPTSVEAFCATDEHCAIRERLSPVSDSEAPIGR